MNDGAEGPILSKSDNKDAHEQGFRQTILTFHSINAEWKVIASFGCFEI
jgi:hypothetical protein